MPKVEYVEMDIKLGFFERRCYMRNYAYNINNDSYTVKFKEKISKALGKNKKVKVIVPSVTVTDKNNVKWYQVIDEFGNTGFLRGTHFDRNKLVTMAGTDKKTLDKPYRYFADDNSRTIYEYEHGNINKISKRNYSEAKKNRRSSEHSVDSIFSQLFSYVKNRLGFNYDKKNEVFDTELNPCLMTQFGLGAYKSSTDKEAFDRKHPGFFQDSSRKDMFDYDSFANGNRAYAERLTKERHDYRVECKGLPTGDFSIPQELENESQGVDEQLNNGDDSAFFKKQIEKHGGICFSENHQEPFARQYIANNMELLHNAGVNTVYLEHLFDGRMQEMVDEYLTDPNIKELPPAMKRIFHQYEYLKEILENAKKYNVRVVGLATEIAQTDTKEGNNHIYRAREFNEWGVQIIGSDQAGLSPDKKGFVVLAGTAHCVMHEDENGRAINGFSNRLGNKGIHIVTSFDGNSLKRVDSAQYVVADRSNGVKYASASDKLLMREKTDRQAEEMIEKKEEKKDVSPVSKLRVKQAGADSAEIQSDGNMIL